MVEARPQDGRNALSRAPAGFAADVVVHGGQGAPVRSVVDDISEGGMRLRTLQPVESGTNMFVAFTFPGDDHVTDVAVEVITWEQPAPGLFVAHCRFVDLPARTSRRIASWVHLPRPTRPL
jgi:hypothetical protein